MNSKEKLYFALCILLFVLVGLLQSWNVALAMVNFALVSAILSLGLNIQWGYGGLFNVGIMGFVAIGGLAVVMISATPVTEAWSAAGIQVLLALALGLAGLGFAAFLGHKIPTKTWRFASMSITLIITFILFRSLFDEAAQTIETINPAISGYLGGLGLPVLIAWPVGGLLAAGIAVIIGRIALGLRSDYLAIATLAIAEVIIALLKHEEWLTRGVKNVTGLPRPVPYEIDLQKASWFQIGADYLGLNLAEASSIAVKLCYTTLLLIILIVLFTLCEKALNSPWGRMMRAIRDNERAASAMGKNVKRRHLHLFVLGSAVFGIAGAMMTTLDGQFTPGSYQPMRFTFLIWIMVIVGGSGNNWGAVLGGLLVWFLWIQVEPIGLYVVDLVTHHMAPDSAIRLHLIESAAHMRFVMMGIFLLVTLRFRPQGLIPERSGVSSRDC